MTLRIALRPRALEDLSDIWDFTASAWSTDQADAYLRAMDKTFKTLAEFPELARLRTEFEPAVRVYTFRKHVIIYVASQTELDVIRVVHGRADWAIFLVE